MLATEENQLQFMLCLKSVYPNFLMLLLEITFSSLSGYAPWSTCCILRGKVLDKHAVSHRKLSCKFKQQ